MLTGKIIKFSVEERNRLREKKERERNWYELANMGGFEMVYPYESMEMSEDAKEFMNICEKREDDL
jgi:hypothetical protein